MGKSKIKRFLGKYVVPFTPLNIKEIRGIILDKDLKSFLSKVKIKGEVLDIGAQRAQYRKYFEQDKYLTLDIVKEHKPDICCDAHDIKSKSNRFELAFATELLEHCYNPQKVVDEIHRILKPGGIALVSVPFMYHYHIAPGVKDYFRFTKDGLREMFKKYEKLEVKEQGNKIHLIWDNIVQSSLLTKFIFSIFNPLIAFLGKKRGSNYPLGYILVAKKPKK